MTRVLLLCSLLAGCSDPAPEPPEWTTESDAPDVWDDRGGARENPWSDDIGYSTVVHDTTAEMVIRNLVIHDANGKDATHDRPPEWVTQEDER